MPSSQEKKFIESTAATDTINQEELATAKLLTIDELPTTITLLHTKEPTTELIPTIPANMRTSTQTLAQPYMQISQHTIQGEESEIIAPLSTVHQLFNFQQRSRKLPLQAQAIPKPNTFAILKSSETTITTAAKAARNITAKTHVTDEANEQDEKELYEKIYQKYPIIFAKSVRNDQYCFWHHFLPEILEELYETRYKIARQLIRKTKRVFKPPDKFNFKTTRNGVVDLNDPLYQPEFSKAEKEHYTKKQSVTVISTTKAEEYYPHIFGDSRRENLVGIALFYTPNEQNPLVLPTLYMLEDGNTQEKPYLHQNLKEANDYYNDKKYNKKTWYNTLENLIIAGRTLKKKFNEILARIKWIPNDPRCHIAIFTDNQFSRILAQLRTMDMKINISSQDISKQFVPISFYISEQTKKNQRKIYPYFLKEQQQDLQIALNSSDVSIKAMALIISACNGNVDAIDLINNSATDLKLKILELFISNQMTDFMKIHFLEKYLKIDLAQLTPLEKYQLITYNFKFMLHEIAKNNPHFNLQAIFLNALSLNQTTFKMSLDAINFTPHTINEIPPKLKLFNDILNGDTTYNDVLKNLDHFPNPNDITSSKGNSMLFIALTRDCENSHKKLIELLKNKQVKSNLNDLLSAIKNNQFNILATLIECLDPKDNNNIKALALGYAIQQNKLAAVEALIQLGCNPNKIFSFTNKPYPKYTALTLALSLATHHNTTAIVNKLLEYPNIDVNLNPNVEEEEYSPLCLAISNLDITTIKKLLSKQANITLYLLILTQDALQHSTNIDVTQQLTAILKLLNEHHATVKLANPAKKSTSKPQAASPPDTKPKWKLLNFIKKTWPKCR